MTKLLKAALATSFVLALASCGGGGGGGGGGGSPAASTATTGTVSGVAVSSTTGTPVAGVTVTSGTQTTTTDPQGSYTLASVPNGTAVVTFTSNSHALQARQVTVSGGVTSSLNVQMVPVTATVPFDPAAGGALAVPGTPAQVTLTGGSLRTATGALPAAGQATSRLTPINPALNPELMPGNYSVAQAGGGTSQFESFGAFDMTFSDSAGNALNLASGQTATIRIPVATRATVIPATMPLMYYDTATGVWQQQGTATLQGTAPNQYYEGTVTHFTNWNADQVYNTSRISVCVRDASNQAVAGARVVSDGIDYSGSGSATTDASGNAVVSMKRGGQAAITATSGTRISNTESVTAVQSAGDFTLTPCLTLAAQGSGMTIRLTWGNSPDDLDSHLKGPNSAHVYYAAQGSLTSAPFAALDVDDTTSFGPEVVTVTRLAVGQYSYFVHNFSGTFSPGQTGSPARVELQYGSQTQIFNPPAGEGTNEYWRVFDFTVNADCTVTFTTVQSWSASEPANPSGTASGTFCNTSTQPAAGVMINYVINVEQAAANPTKVKVKTR